MGRPRVIVALAAAAVSVNAAGCGSGAGGGNARPAAKPAMTHAQYVVGGNAVCRATVAHSPGFPGKKVHGRLTTTPKLLTPYLLAVQNLTLQAQKGIRALRPPPELRAAHREVLAAQEARITDMGLALNAAQSTDGAALNRAIKQDTNVDGPRYRAAVEAAGLSACTRRR